MPILANRLAVVFVAACLLPASALEAASGDRQPTPSTAAQTAAMARLNKQFDFAELRKKEEPGKLAGAMLQQAIDTNGDPELRYVLFLRTRELAIEAHDARLALASIDELAKHFEVDILGAKTSTLQGILKGAKSDEVHVSDLIEQLADEAMTLDRYDIADDLTALSERLAGNDQDLKKEHHLRRTEIRAMQQKFAALQQSVADLEKSPADPELNLAVGRYRTYYKGDWRRGIPMLALGSDARLSEIAQRELRSPATPVEIKKIGDDWWNLATSESGLPKKNVQDHAVDLYRQALPGLEGLDKLAVEKRLPAQPQVKQQKPPVGKWVKIVNKFSGLAAGVGGHKQQRRVRQHEFKPDAEGLQWQIHALKDGYYKIVNKSNGHVLGIAGGSDEDGGRAVNVPFNEASVDQQWKFETTAAGSYRLVNRNSKRVLGVDRRSRSAGTEITQLELRKDDPPEQHWQIIRIEH